MTAKARWMESLLGIAACLLGAGGLAVLPYAARADTSDPWWPLVFWSVGWLLIGVGLPRLPQRLLARRFPQLRGEDLVGGALLLFAGMGLAAIPWLDAREGAFPLGRLPVGAVGAIFALGGVMVLHHAFVPRGRGDTLFFHTVVALLLSLFAAVVGGIAAMLAFAPPRPSAWWIPLPGALLLLVVAVNAWREVWRVLRQK